jgi:uncharacterized flavoprotein (TIGR03862 family)
MPSPASPHVVIIGGGPAGLMAAETIASALIPSGGSVTVYDQKPSVGRKFLLAGRGGLNLTHSEDFDTFVTRYGAAGPRLRPILKTFPPAALRAWCEALGQPTFVGSSGRVFPVAMKASPLLRAWLARLRTLGVAFRPRCRWTGWDDAGHLVFQTPEGVASVAPDATILALGGASWPRLGSDGSWAETLMSAGISVSRLRPSNCGFTAGWSETLRERFQGEPLKGVELRFGEARARGDVIVTRTGLEGGAIYALSAALRDAIDATGEAVLRIDLRPNLSRDDLECVLSGPRDKLSLAGFLRKKAKLTSVAVSLLHEAVMSPPEPATPRKLTDLSANELTNLIKGVPIRLTSTAPIERAISTAGGASFDELDERLMVRRQPGLFAAGEMLDWEAPTGGYLLQGCFASGVAAGRGVLDWLTRG